MKHLIKTLDPLEMYCGAELTPPMKGKATVIRSSATCEDCIKVANQNRGEESIPQPSGITGQLSLFAQQEGPLTELPALGEFFVSCEVDKVIRRRFFVSEYNRILFEAGRMYPDTPDGWEAAIARYKKGLTPYPKNK